MKIIIYSKYCLMFTILLFLCSCRTISQVEFDVFGDYSLYNDFRLVNLKPNNVICSDSLYDILAQVSQNTVYDCFIMTIDCISDSITCDDEATLCQSVPIRLEIASDLLENISKNIYVLNSQNLIKGVIHDNNKIVKDIFVIGRNMALLDTLFLETNNEIEFKRNKLIQLPKYVRLMYIPDAFSRIKGVIHNQHFELHLLEIDGKIIYKQ